jgi:hypothetical protein
MPIDSEQLRTVKLNRPGLRGGTPGRFVGTLTPHPVSVSAFNPSINANQFQDPPRPRSGMSSRAQTIQDAARYALKAARTLWRVGVSLPAECQGASRAERIDLVAEAGQQLEAELRPVRKWAAEQCDSVAEAEAAAEAVLVALLTVEGPSPAMLRRACDAAFALQGVADGFRAVAAREAVQDELAELRALPKKLRLSRVRTDLVEQLCDDGGRSTLSDLIEACHWVGDVKKSAYEAIRVLNGILAKHETGWQIDPDDGGSVVARRAGHTTHKNMESPSSSGGQARGEMNPEGQPCRDSPPSPTRSATSGRKRSRRPA